MDRIFNPRGGGERTVECFSVSSLLDGAGLKPLSTERFRGPCYEYIPEDDILGVAEATWRLTRHQVIDHTNLKG